MASPIRKTPDPPNKSERATRTRARTPVQLQRQERVFDLAVVSGKSYRLIAKELGIALETVVSDMRHEEARRAEELTARRETEKARAVAFYDEVAREGMRLARRSDETVEFGGDGPHAGVASPYSSLARGLDAAIKARERVDKILGLDAPTRVEVGLQGLLDALDVPPDGDKREGAR